MVVAANDKLTELAAHVAAAYFSNSHVGVGEIPTVVANIAASLAAVGQKGAPPATQRDKAAAMTTRLTPAQIRKSITADALISFEDGSGYKMLRRHLSTRGLSPDAYREKWGLPKDYPMVAPNFSAARSTLAKNRSLGQKGQGARRRDARARV